MKWRVWVLVALLGGAVVAGAFFLPRDDGDTALADAVHTTLAAKSFRTTIRGKGNTEVEDYQAPNRVRIVVSSLGDVGQVLISIGSTFFSGLRCQTASGTREVFSQSHSRQPFQGSGYGLLSVLGGARNVHAVGDGRFATALRLPVPAKKSTELTYRSVPTVVTVAGGKVRAITIGGRDFGPTRLTFSRFGHVTPIEPPKHATTKPTITCGNGVALTSGNS